MSIFDMSVGVNMSIDFTSHDVQNHYVMIASRWEAICYILEGKEPSDFMLSFPEVREVFDLINLKKEA